LDRLQVEDEFKVAHALKDGRNRATSITVKRNEVPKRSPPTAG
jgi:hypothetical protein